MPDKNSEPPPGQQDRESQPGSGEIVEPRNLETARREPDANHDERRLEDQEINLHGSER